MSLLELVIWMIFGLACGRLILAFFYLMINSQLPTPVIVQLYRMFLEDWDKTMRRLR